MINRYLLALLLLLISVFEISAQISIGDDSISFSKPKTYEISGITFSGISDNLDKNILLLLSGLNYGSKVSVPGEAFANAIEKLWSQGLFSDVRIEASKIEGDKIFVNFILTEKPRLSRYQINGIKKGEADDIREKLKLIRGKPINDNLIVSAKNTVVDFLIDKGYLNATADIEVKPDTSIAGGTILYINANKGGRVKIKKINFIGNNSVKAQKLKRKMKNTKENPFYSIFTTSKLVEQSFQEDKEKVEAYYQELGFKDAKVVSDSVYRHDKKHIIIDIKVAEGNRYYFRNINWIGNSKYSTKMLSEILAIKKGDLYNQGRLEQNLFMNASNTDITSLYMDDGHLFFQVTPVETLVGKDSIDVEIRIYEGKQATINRVTINGNEKTNDKVILREMRTRPGQLFRRSDIIRTQRELISLGYFDQEKFGVNPVPNPLDGTVDINYTVTEKPSDQIELSGGWGGGRVIGTLGVSFNNFAAGNMFKKEAWRPLPSGEGQRLSIRAQSNGVFLQSYNFSFTEPWLGGKKPNSLSVSVFHTVINYNGRPKTDPTRSVVMNTGASIGLGKRLRKPDDFFSTLFQLSYQYFNLQNAGNQFILDNGFSNNISFLASISRNSIDAPIYPRSGGNISLSIQTTPPYSAFDPEGRTYNTDQQKYLFAEYHKWKFDMQWFNKLLGNLVLMTRTNFGFIGSYNESKGLAPFERFQVGGSGLSGFNFSAQFLGRDIVGLRGYSDGSLSPTQGAAIYNRYTMELRYPVSLNPSATVFGLAFIEGGNTWMQFKNFDPFDIRRAAGVGVRVFLPMFGLLGLDYGWRFDEAPTPGVPRSQLHFIIGQSFN